MQFTVEPKSSEPRCPKELYILTSDGQNRLPAVETTCLLMMDENVHQRLSRLDCPWVAHLNEWLSGYRVSSKKQATAMSSFALERNLQGERRQTLAEVERTSQELGEIILFGRRHPFSRKQSLRVVGRGRVPDGVLGLAVQAYINCAEISWVRMRVKRQPKKEELLQLCLDFIDWRVENLPDAPRTVCTLLCLDALAGSEAALKMLKVRKPAREVRNGAFDALHLSQFAEASATRTIGATAKPPLVVLATADQDMAEAISEYKVFETDGRLSTALRLKYQLLSKKGIERLNFAMQTRNTRLPSTPTTPLAVLRQSSRAIELLYKNESIPDEISKLRDAARNFAKEHGLC